MKTKLLVVAAFLMCFLSLAKANDDKANEDDDTLRFFLSKSPLVVSGQITSPIRKMKTIPGGLALYTFDFKVEETAKGNLSEAESKSLRVTIQRNESYAIEELDLLKQNGTFILFLKPKDNAAAGAKWHSADLWFSVQPYNYHMLQELKRLSKQQVKT